VAKHCSKAEAKSKSYQELSREILPRIAHHNPVVSFASKLMNKPISERDWSAQEVCHLLMQLPLQEGSRVVRAVDCRPHNRQRTAIIRGDDTNRVVDVRSQYQKYLERPALWADITYFDILSHIDFSHSPQNWRRIQRSKPRVLNYFPRYKSDPEAEQFKDFYRIKLMLNHRHRHPDELKVVDDTRFDTYRKVYAYYLQIHQHDDNYYGEVAVPVPEEQFEEPPDEALGPGDWDELAAELPNHAADVEDIDILGNRDLDLNHSWEPQVGRYPGLEPATTEYWKRKKADHGAGEEMDEFPPGAADTLNTEQRIIFDLYIGHYKAFLRGDNPTPLLLQVDGRGGTGKSHVIRLLSSRLNQLAKAAGQSSPIIRATPTGVAANNINGSTLHSLLRLPVSKKGDINTLNAAERSKLQSKLGKFRYFIIDEKSIIGLRLLAAISSRIGKV
jgi:hypothetical protein